MSQNYLNDNFDPNKVSKANLRKILGSNNVKISLSASKKDLVKVFDANIENIRSSKNTNNAEPKKTVVKTKGNSSSPPPPPPSSSSSSSKSSSVTTTTSGRTGDSPKKRKLRNKQSKLNNLRKKHDKSFSSVAQNNIPAEVIVLDDDDDDDEDDNIDDGSGFDQDKAKKGQQTKTKQENSHITLNFPSDPSVLSKKRSRQKTEELAQEAGSMETTSVASNFDNNDIPSLKSQPSTKKQKKEKSPNSIAASLDSDVHKSENTDEETLSDFLNSIKSNKDTPNKIGNKNHKLEEHKSLVIDKFEDTGSSLENVSTHSINSALNRSFSIVGDKAAAAAAAEAEAEEEEKLVAENDAYNVVLDSNNLMPVDDENNDDAKNEKNIELFKKDIDLEKMNVSEEFKQMLQKAKDNAAKEKQPAEAGQSAIQIETGHLVAPQDVDTEMQKTVPSETKSSEAEKSENEVGVSTDKNNLQEAFEPLAKTKQVLDDQHKTDKVEQAAEGDKHKTVIQTFEKKLANVGNEVNSFVDVLMEEVQETVEQPVQPIKQSDDYAAAERLPAKTTLQKTIAKPIKKAEQLLSEGTTAMASLGDVVKKEVEKAVEQPVEQSEDKPSSEKDTEQTTLQDTAAKSMKKVEQLVSKGSEAVGSFADVVVKEVEETVEEPLEQSEGKLLSEKDTEQTTLQDAAAKSMKKVEQLVSKGSEAVGSFADVVVKEVEKTVEEPVEHSPEQEIENNLISPNSPEQNKNESTLAKDSDMEAFEKSAAINSFVDVVMDEVEKSVEEPVKDEIHNKNEKSLQASEPPSDKATVPIEEHTDPSSSLKSSTSFVNDALSIIGTSIEQPVENESLHSESKKDYKPSASANDDIAEENLSFFEEVYQEVQNTLEEPVRPILELKKRKVSKRKSEKLAKPHKSHRVSKKSDTKKSTRKMDKKKNTTKSPNKIRSFSIHLRLKKFIIQFAKFLYTVVLFMVFLVPILYALWYREQQVAVGYCGHTNNAKSSQLEFKNMFGNPFAENGSLNNLGQYEFKFIDKLENWVDSTKPKCIPCPNDTAYCFSDLEVKCKTDHIKEKTVKSLYGLIPAFFHDEGIYQCVKNHEKEQMVEEAVSKILKILEFKNAQKDCGLSKDDIEVGMDVEELKKIFLEARKPWFKIENFEDVWNKVLEHLKNEPEITWRQTSPVEAISRTNRSKTLDQNEQAKEIVPKQKIFVRSRSLKYTSWNCKYEQLILSKYRENKIPIFSALILLSMSQVIKYKYEKHQAEQTMIKDFTSKILKYLQINKRRSMHGQVVYPYLSSVQLRDILSNDNESLSNKNKIWNKISKHLEKNNSTIKTELIEFNGEIMKVWEWVGPLDLLESQK